MDQLKEVCAENYQADESKTLPTGKSPGSLCHSFTDEDCFDEAKLELESAQLEIEVAEAMKRAAEAKRRAAEAIRRKGKPEAPGLVNVDDEVHSRLVVIDVGRESHERASSEYSAPAELKGSGKEQVNYEVHQLERLMSTLELPRCEIPSFDGSPLQYVPFFRQFEEQIEKRVQDHGKRLSYLYNYCQGKAREAIQGCLLYSVSDGYRRARQILRERFGERHIIARAMLDDVTKPGLVSTEPDDISSYADKLVSCVDALEQLGYLSDLNSVHMIDKVLSKLPRFMAVDWVRRSDEIYQSDREPGFRDLCEFVCLKARLQRSRYSYLLQGKRESTGILAKNPSVRKHVYVISAEIEPCAKCGQQHDLNNCEQFIALGVRERWNFVSGRKLCFVCLKSGHHAGNCPNKKLCDENGCGRPHHSSLHQSHKISRLLNASCQRFPNECGVSLGVIPVVVEGPKGSIMTNALLDTGADTSLIRSDLAKTLGLVGRTESVQMMTPVGSKVEHSSCVSFSVKSLDGMETVDAQRAYTVASILDVDAAVPDGHLLSKWNHLKGIDLISLADRTVGVLIGLDVPEAHWVIEQRTGRKGEPYAVCTLFGWVLRGPLDRRCSNRVRSCACHVSQRNLEDDFRRLYDQEFLDCGSAEVALSVEDERAIDLAERSLRLDNGHFSIGLPWKDDRLGVYCNRVAAQHRLNLLARRLLRDEQFRKKYTQVMDRYIQLGYAVDLKEARDKSEGPKWFLPHHAVLNPKKPEKVRVVFDCAATFKGESLNGHLLQGPNMVTSLVGILIRFRQGPVAIAADIEDMFLQVRVPVSDQDALRFLWWPNGDLSVSPREFRLTTHPFGAVSSPFCASFALKKTATMFGTDLEPNISRVVLNSFYVDDCLVSVNDQTEATTMIEGLSHLLKCGGFRLTKWSSNDRGVLERISPSERSNAVRSLSVLTLPTERTLGLAWNMEMDSFEFQIPNTDFPSTRRALLSQVAAIYDPLGLISPYILPMKQLLQVLCREGIGWDTQLESDIQIKWQQSKKILDGVKLVNIPRWYAHSLVTSECEIELHVFCDASEVGYGAVAYLRFTSKDENSHCSLVLSKARVAPLKPVTIPRLELNAAVLAVELANVIKSEMELSITQVVFWTDSVIVLYYLRNDKSRFATFVANRVRRIRDHSTPAQWRHVAGRDNPADLASRGMRTDENAKILWFNGPTFLRLPGYVKSDTGSIPLPSPVQLELKTRVLAAAVSPLPLLNYFERFSSWIVLVRCMAWILRFKQYIVILSKGQVGMSLRIGPLTVQDIRDSCRAIIKIVQHSCYGREIEIVRTGKRLKRHLMSTNLHKLNPIMRDDLFCVGGRLQWSNLADEVNHPIILPPKHFITNLIIKYYHEVEGHVGCTQVLATIRKRYWIIQGRAAVRRTIGQCLTCRRESVPLCWQQMAPLPKERLISMGHAFAQVGVDYFGPIYVKRGKTEEKRYGCLFTCLNIRAVHIEVTHSLTTDAFIQALIRFMARRGLPSVIFSDNGSNFKGAFAELKNSLMDLSQERIHRFMAEREIEWHFSPPEASHWGGVWERMIRSVRRILKVVARSQRMTDETLLTFLAETERIVNNRPLIPITEDVKDLEVLTPNKLLLLRGGETIFDRQDFPRSCVRFWRRVQLLADTFWKRWKSEYLTALQERQKWFDKTKPLKPGDLVLVTTDKVHRNQWPLAVIEQVCPSSDGLVREVIVRTSKGTMKRDLRKLCLLEGNFVADN